MAKCMMAACGRGICVVAMAIACQLLAGGRVRAEIPREERQLLEGLRARRLFSLAERHCQELSRRQELSDADRAEIVAEWLKLRAERALHAAADQQQAMWAAVHELAERYLAQQARSPHASLVRVQHAVCYLVQAEALRQQADAAQSVEKRQGALEALRLAIALLEQADRELDEQIARARRGVSLAEQREADRLLARQHDVRLHMASAYRIRAECYPDGSPDRIDSLRQAIERYEDLLRRLPEDEPRRGQLHVELATCFRLLHNLEQARGQLALASRRRGDAALVAAVMAETIRLEIAAERPAAALALAEQAQQTISQPTAQLDLAVLEALLAAAAADPQSREKWQQKAIEQAQRIEERYGSYWARRASDLLVRAAGTSGVASDFRILKRVAEQAYLRQQLDEAVRAYDEAARQALAAQQPEEAFALAYTAALIEQRRGRFDQASRRLCQLARQLADLPRAAQAHLLGIWNAAQVARQQPDRLSDYAALLEEHLRLWPSGETADRARLWLARLRQHEQSCSEAIDLYLEVSPGSEHFAEAIESAAVCAESYVRSLRGSGAVIDEAAKLLAAKFEDLVPDVASKQTWNAGQRMAAIVAAHWRLQSSDPQRQAVVARLEAALRQPEGLAASWRNRAAALLVVALAGLPDRRAEAFAKLKSLGEADPGQLVLLIEQIQSLMDSSEGESRRQLAALQLQALDVLGDRASALGEATAVRCKRLRAEALWEVGQIDESRRLFETLVDRYPQDAEVIERYAARLMSSAEPADLRAALSLWRRLDRGSRPGSERWYRAKYHIALAHVKLGERERAAQLIEYLMATPPGISDPKWQQQFQSLLDQCRNK